MTIKKLREYLKKNKVVVLSVLLIASMFFGIYKSTKVYLYEKRLEEQLKYNISKFAYATLNSSGEERNEDVFEDRIEPTGMALIMVNDNGNNSIIVNAGSNMTLTKDEIHSAENLIKESDIIISQFETPEDITIEAFKIAKENGKVTILNPAPAKKIKDELLNYTDIIVPNETEAELLTGIEIKYIEDAKKAGDIFLGKGVKFAIITLGEKGAALIGKDFCEIVPAYRVNAIDTTAAGDSFIGGLSSKLDTKNLGRETLSSSIRFGNKVSSIAVQRKGAQPSIPYLKEVLEVYKGEE